MCGSVGDAVRFEIKLPAITGDMVPLFAIADAMARRDATAGGTDFHEPVYKGRLARYESMLLKHVRARQLRTCDDDGDVGEPAVIVQRRIARGGVRVLRDVAPPCAKKGRKREPVLSADVTPDGLAVDEDQTWLINLFVNLKALNDWASGIGHEFAVTHDGVSWCDERGVVRPGATDKATLYVPVAQRCDERGVSRPDATLPADETPEDRDDRRYRELVAAGGDYVHDGKLWGATGPRGLSAKLWKREKAAGRPMSHETDVRESLKKAATRAKAARDAGLKGNSVFNQ